MRKLSIAAAIAATAFTAAPDSSAGNRITPIGYGTSQHGWGSEFKNPNRYRKKDRRQKVKAARKANLRRARS